MLIPVKIGLLNQQGEAVACGPYEGAEVPTEAVLLLDQAEQQLRDALGIVAATAQELGVHIGAKARALAAPRSSDAHSRWARDLNGSIRFFQGADKQGVKPSPIRTQNMDTKAF